MANERGIQINLTAEDVDKLVASLQRGTEERVRKMKELGVDVSTANQGEHCGVIICGG